MMKTYLALLEATEAWMANEMKAGRLLEVWEKADATGGIAITEMDSNEALYQKLLENPTYPFNQWTVTPLVDLSVAIGEAKKLYQKMIGG
jgi:muconolactone delta-isomerase